jgi:DNA-binding HxlR family transcriptional regulator
LKVFAKELKDLEEHKRIKRTVIDDTPVLVEYITTEYSTPLGNLIRELRDWALTIANRLLVNNIGVERNS